MMNPLYVDSPQAESVMPVEISSLVRDAGTHGRESIDPMIVGTYADLMEAVGTYLTPIVVFSDGQRTVLADGFHRVAAAERNGLDEIQAEIRVGSANDALWYALGALRPSCHAARVSDRDLRHAIRRAYETWPDLSLLVVAEQIGVQSIYVAQVQDGLRKTVRVPRDSDVTTHPKYAQMREMLRDGLKSREVAKALGVRDDVVAAVRRIVRGGEKRTAPHRQKAHEQIRAQAGRGYGSRQIAKSVGLSEERVRVIAKIEGFEISADKTIGKSKRLDPNRIMEKIAMSADTLVDGSELVEYQELDQAELSSWLESLTDCREKLGSLIRRLQKEQV